MVRLAPGLLLTVNHLYFVTDNFANAGAVMEFELYSMLENQVSMNNDVLAYFNVNRPARRFDDNRQFSANPKGPATTLDGEIC